MNWTRQVSVERDSDEQQWDARRGRGNRACRSHIGCQTASGGRAIVPGASNEWVVRQRTHGCHILHALRILSIRARVMAQAARRTYAEEACE